MRNKEILHRLDATEKNLQILTLYLNSDLAICTRFCQKCEHDTVQKILTRTPAMYRCLSCGINWQPRIPDDAVGDDALKERIGFQTEVR